MTILEITHDRACQERRAAVTPSLGWMLRHPARMIAFGAGSGLLRPAPGTWGTLFAWITFAPVTAALGGVLGGPIGGPIGGALGGTLGWMPDGPQVLLAPSLAFVIGVWACGTAARDMGVADPGGIVWDEIAAFWLVLALVPATLSAQLAAFVLFRLFDIVKPPPIRYFDANIKNGFGVMFDDTLAAGYTLLVMAIWQRMTV